MEHNRVDVVYTLLLNEDKTKILVVLNRNGTWTLPGGAVEASETLTEAAVREVKEETGYDVKVGNIAGINEAFLGDNHVYFITYYGEIIQAPAVITHDEAILEVKWVPVCEVDEMMPYRPDSIAALIDKPGASYTLQP
ncbi:NUDIX hydrolase [Pseudalkalibacillus caeni]|uniref:NUDIX hydrolase n=1 Tax=Exobacillus caeni TaxID=2574798 RepID=A0A5R9EXW9_9BACL|nr:NUDIX hydrolase [Pseudalkalibacillus caeni]TLS36132.1 NUDIX hydrolase [Pseudalkalibacillus caeni]